MREKDRSRKDSAEFSKKDLLPCLLCVGRSSYWKLNSRADGIARECGWTAASGWTKATATCGEWHRGVCVVRSLQDIQTKGR
ncbi:hypothetical protein PC118_g10984 [Phytophthora cactorum]|uniref:Uncharacterized protein n=1 Tax=Phytophthora cactorum TaxID=29920 RepID=A0A8T1FW32_9STRA|nr:hypothetical protein PC112_g11140 [Phytophthora cactorum]KAG2918455.1 hypothetical protein PC114_g6827 [Phytophthora cactorum]KAG2980794.1 hypothetical protein PC118_g10984 [Phytophthora cactorum]KAG3006236.1 hypothetical protein PC120_g17481 [Phytophthora cactorum]KAG3180272.1 hypothetical protein C6341_g7012 [Phytophthora cactorum]